MALPTGAGAGCDLITVTHVLQTSGPHSRNLHTHRLGHAQASGLHVGRKVRRPPSPAPCPRGATCGDKSIGQRLRDPGGPALGPWLWDLGQHGNLPLSLRSGGRGLGANAPSQAYVGILRTSQGQPGRAGPPESELDGTLSPFPHGKLRWRAGGKHTQSKYRDPVRPAPARPSAPPAGLGLAPWLPESE